MPAPISDDERARIIQLLDDGKSCNVIAREVGRSSSTISNVARSIGHRFGHSNLAHAREVRSAYSKEKRAELAARATEAAERLLADLEREYTVFNFGGKDNTYNERLMDRPPVEAQRQMIQGFRDLMRTVLEVDRHDNRSDDNLSAVDEWLRSIVGETAA